MTEKLQNALNEQITAELWSANLYLSMSFYLEREGFSGMARWMQKQSAEETGHAYALSLIHICFIKHNRVYKIQLHRLSAHVVHHTPWSSYDDLCSTL